MERAYKSLTTIVSSMEKLVEHLEAALQADSSNHYLESHSHKLENKWDIYEAKWVRNRRSTIPYVQNRVNNILKLGETYVYNHIESKQNPADLLTRGVSHRLFQGSELWFKGPLWTSRPIAPGAAGKGSALNLYVAHASLSPLGGCREISTIL